MSERQVYAERTHRYAAPRWVVFEALVDTDTRRRWLVQEQGEVEPSILETVDEQRIVWSSLWPVAPDDTVEFQLRRDGGGTALRFEWITSQPPAREVWVSRASD